MRKGFSVTLAMVAFAMLAYNASAYAPTITDLPDIVVGDAEDSSDANIFVFTDAINLNAKVSDDLTSAAGIIWTYSEADSQYLINKALPSNPLTDNLVSPAANKRVDNQSDPRDSNGPRTATIRDNVRSPYTVGGGAGPYTPADCVSGRAPTVLGNSRVITMYASDGSTVSTNNAKSFVVYSIDNGLDAYSPAEDIVYEPVMTGAQPAGWTPLTQAGVAPATFGPDGLCITVGLTGDNDASWRSAYGVVTLAANSVWEARLTVTTSQTVASAMPVWVLVYDNYGGTAPSTGNNEYGGECFFIDNTGSANSAIASIGRTGAENFKVFMMPIQEQTDQFTNSTSGFMSPTWDSQNDMRINLRVMDYGSSSYGAASDSGNVCWSGLKVVRHDLADMNNEGTPDMNVTTFADARVAPLTASSFMVEGLTQAGFDQSTVTFGATAATIAPVSNWNSATVLIFRPGDLTLNMSGTGDTSVNFDNWPIPWVANSLYYIEFNMKAADAAAEIDPPDVIRVGADEATNEIVFDNFLVPNTNDTPFSTRGVSSPRAAAPQKYACFFYSHSVSTTTWTNMARWRPRLDILCSSTVDPLGRPGNAHGVMVTSMKVQKVNFTK